MLRRLALTGCLCAIAACAPIEPTPPNVILISLDTTRSDHCSVYGYKLETTPNLRRIAAEGARFDLAYSPTSTTGPTHASLFTSLYPMEHGVVKNGLFLGEYFTTLAEHLHESAYQTAAVVSSFVLDAKFGYGQGFDFYDDDFDWESSKIHMKEWAGHQVEHGFDRRGDEVTSRALRWLDQECDTQRPFFLFLHYFDAHNPFDPPEPYRSRFASPHESPSPLDTEIGLYDGGIAFEDAQVGAVLDALKARQLSENTIIIVIGDHGEGLLQHGLMNHGMQIYEEQVRVPFLMSWPGHIQPGSSFASPVELLDLAPTLFELIGIDVQEHPMKGRSLARALRGKESYEAADRPVFLFRRHYNEGEIPGIAGQMYGVRAGGWKYIDGPAEQRRELFDLVADPLERSNVFSSRPDIASTLQQMLDTWREETSVDPLEQPEISEEDREALRALGYIE